MIKMKHYLPVFVGASLALFSHHTLADQKISDDLIVVGSLCVGLDCVNGESFNYDTIRMKENNVRIRFIDTSGSSSFPTRDWELTANESTNGGLNMFAITNVDANTTPFTIIDGAPTGSIYVRNNGWVGFGTTAPIMQLHVVDSNSPTLRLEQDQGAGFAAQAWDVGGNETNFFVRDVTNGGVLPLRIQTNATNASLYIGTSGKIGFGTTTPDGLFDVAHPANANNHALLLSTVGDFGVNIDNGFNPLGLLDIQTTGGYSRFLVNSSGNVGIGAGTAGSISGRFDLKSLDGTKSYFNVGSTGNIGIGTASGSNLFNIQAGALAILGIKNDGQTTLTTTAFDADATICGGANGTFSIACGRFTPAFLLEETNVATQGRMMFNLKSNAPSWLGFEDTVQNTQWYITNASDALSYAFYNKTISEITVPFALSSNGNLTITGALSQGSSVHSKENFHEIDADKILDSIDQLEITQWQYKKDAASTTHIGPMAQDFYHLFNVGADDEHISSLDLNGVSLAAIQSLHKKIKQLEAKLETLQAKQPIN